MHIANAHSQHCCQNDGAGISYTDFTFSWTWDGEFHVWIIPNPSHCCYPRLYRKFGCDPWLYRSYRMHCFWLALPKYIDKIGRTPEHLGQMAQLVERQDSNLEVIGSNPALSQFFFAQPKIKRNILCISEKVYIIQDRYNFKFDVSKLLLRVQWTSRPLLTWYKPQAIFSLVFFLPYLSYLCGWIEARESLINKSIKETNCFPCRALMLFFIENLLVSSLHKAGNQFLF